MPKKDVIVQNSKKGIATKMIKKENKRGNLKIHYIDPDQGDFLMLPKEPLLSNRDYGLMSLQALGLYYRLSSLPPNWEYNDRGMAIISGCGVDKVKTARKELEKFGYFESKKQERNDKGHFKPTQYVFKQSIDNTYLKEFPYEEEPIAEIPYAEKNAQYNTINNKKNKQIKDIKKYNNAETSSCKNDEGSLTINYTKDEPCNQDTCIHDSHDTSTIRNNMIHDSHGKNQNPDEQTVDGAKISDGNIKPKKKETRRNRLTRQIHDQIDQDFSNEEIRTNFKDFISMLAEQGISTTIVQYERFKQDLEKYKNNTDRVKALDIAISYGKPKLNYDLNKKTNYQKTPNNNLVADIDYYIDEQGFFHRKKISV